MELSPSGSSRRGCAEVNNAVMCLVDGCAADLSDCRKYYQRHKVCEIHSKSPQVSINGETLRFCQQCSRFHSLEEFDEGKRSCRKRLDGHNRRRRKPRPQHLFAPNRGTNMLQAAGQQVQVLPHPTMALTNPPWDYAPSLLSFSVAAPQASVSTTSHVVQPLSESGSVTLAASALDQGSSCGGLENDSDVGWSGMADMDPHHDESFDPQTLPFYWQSS